VVHPGIRRRLCTRFSLWLSSRRLAIRTGRSRMVSCSYASLVASKDEKSAFGELPVACTLSDTELRQREATLLTHFIEASAISTEELEDVYAFHVRGDRTSMAVVGELIAAERDCCRFLTFELTARPDMGPVTLRMTGPVGTKEFLNSILSISTDGKLNRWT